MFFVSLLIIDKSVFQSLNQKYVRSYERSHSFIFVIFCNRFSFISRIENLIGIAFVAPGLKNLSTILLRKVIRWRLGSQCFCASAFLNLILPPLSFYFFLFSFPPYRFSFSIFLFLSHTSRRSRYYT